MLDRRLLQSRSIHHRRIAHAACARAVRRCVGERRNTGAAGGGAATITAGSAGATCWRYELAAPRAPPAAGVISREKLAVSLDTLPAGELLLRGDSVAF